jgi:antagonist of KipI
MEVKIIRPGMLTTVQDLGRHGHRREGVPAGGAADPFALRLANLLVGNEANTAALEMTLAGAELEFSGEALVAATGADMGGMEAGRPHKVAAGSRVKFCAAKAGCRTYLAVAGGFRVPATLGGCGTDLRARIGGHDGRALRAGDVLTVEPVSREVSGRWRVDPRLLPAYGPAPVVRAVAGAQAEEFGESFYRAVFVVAAQSDRMGLRLQGAKLVRAKPRDLISAAVAPGTVQVPPEGDPIVLLADAQTIGGYPCVAHAIHVDLPLLAQLRPGDRVRFTAVGLEEAHRLWLAQEKALGLLHEGLRGKLR